MVRTEVELTDQQAEQLQLLASRRNVEVSQLVRSMLEEALRQAEADWEEKRRRALKGIGGGHSGLHDLARNHDKYLTEDLWEEIERNRPKPR